MLQRQTSSMILLMAEILHHLACMKPYNYKWWDRLPASASDGRIPSINSILRNLDTKGRRHHPANSGFLQIFRDDFLDLKTLKFIYASRHVFHGPKWLVLCVFLEMLVSQGPDQSRPFCFVFGFDLGKGAGRNLVRTPSELLESGAMRFGWEKKRLKYCWRGCNLIPTCTIHLGDM